MSASALAETQPGQNQTVAIRLKADLVERQEAVAVSALDRAAAVYARPDRDGRTQQVQTRSRSAAGLSTDRLSLSASPCGQGICRVERDRLLSLVCTAHAPDGRGEPVGADQSDERPVVSRINAACAVRAASIHAEASGADGSLRGRVVSSSPEGATPGPCMGALMPPAVSDSEPAGSARPLPHAMSGVDSVRHTTKSEPLCEAPR